MDGRGSGPAGNTEHGWSWLRSEDRTWTEGRGGRGRGRRRKRKAGAEGRQAGRKQLT